MSNSPCFYITLWQLELWYNMSMQPKCAYLKQTCLLTNAMEAGRRVYCTMRSRQHRREVDNQTCQRLSSVDQDHSTTCVSRHRGRHMPIVVGIHQHQATVYELSL